jgi:hypothetical protein
MCSSANSSSLGSVCMGTDGIRAHLLPTPLFAHKSEVTKDVLLLHEKKFAKDVLVCHQA